MEQNTNNTWKISSFSVILIMIVLMIVGAVTLPLLNVQYHPTTGTNNVTVSFSYMASARVVENEVTSLVMYLSPLKRVPI